MKKLFAIMLALALQLLAQEKADVSGVWDLTIESPQGTHTPLATFKVDGEKLTGTLKGQRGEVPLTGTIRGNEIKFTYTIKFQDADLTITMIGTIDKDTMKGTADFGGLASGNWSGKRHQEEKPPATSDKIDITGTWVFTVETDAGTGSPTFTFKQEGEKLTGTYKGMFGEAPIEGTLKGNTINFSFKVIAQGIEATIVYSGTVEKDSMKGTVKLGDLASGTWTAKRK
jgi:hypothetical protein